MIAMVVIGETLPTQQDQLGVRSVSIAVVAGTISRRNAVLRTATVVVVLVASVTAMVFLGFASFALWDCADSGDVKKFTMCHV